VLDDVAAERRVVVGGVERAHRHHHKGAIPKTSRRSQKATFHVVVTLGPSEGRCWFEDEFMTMSFSET
jgi:hypothetical protein